MIDFKRPIRHSTSDVVYPRQLILPTMLSFDLIHWREEKFKCSFRNTLNLMCNCRSAIDILCNFFLHYSKFTQERRYLLHKIQHTETCALPENDNNTAKNNFGWVSAETLIHCFTYRPPLT